jgi:hypothetical protein
MAGDMAQVVECLPCKLEALSSNPEMAEKNAGCIWQAESEHHLAAELNMVRLLLCEALSWSQYQGFLKRSIRSHTYEVGAVLVVMMVVTGLAT